MAVGMTEFSTVLKLTLIPTAQMQANLTAFANQDAAFNAARSAQQTASDAYQPALAAVYEWLLGVSNTLATRFGTRWSREWAQAGFNNNTTAIPSKVEDRLSLVLALVDFFTKNPSYEVPSMNQTAAYGTTLRTTALNAQAAVTAAAVNINSISATWQTAYDTLVKGMRALERERQRQWQRPARTGGVVFGWANNERRGRVGSPPPFHFQNMSARRRNSGELRYGYSPAKNPMRRNFWYRSSRS